MTSIKAHKHQFDLHPTYPTMVYCLVCGFAAPVIMLKSKHNLNAMTARANATDAVLDLIGMSRKD